MQRLIFWIVFVSGIGLVSCGSSDSGESGSAEKQEKVFDPWAGVGSGTLTGEVTERVRELAFADGVTVGYDGSAGDGSEQVCRRQQSEEIWYEVCMPLEDDPYFVMLPNSAFVWHPLMFDRFATELVCHSWLEPETVTDESCDTAFFENMGGEGFRCQASPVNGDKALVCSDHWAVAVNGREGDTKTVCRVHTEAGSGHCLGAPKSGVESDGALLLKMQQTVWSGYGSTQDNPEQFAPGDVGQLVVPQDTPPGARLSFASEDENVCRISEEAVMISAGATAPGTCKIFLTIQAEGYADRVIFVELPILQESDVTWEDYNRINNYFYPGEALMAEAASSTEPAATQNSFESLDDSVCTVDAESGEATALMPGYCMIRLTARAIGYLDTIIEKTLPVDPLVVGAWTIVWNDFPTDAVVGVDTAALTPPQVLDGEDASASEANVSIASESESCTYRAGVLSFGDVGECVITVTAKVGRGYAPSLRKFRVAPVPGSFTLLWTGYANSNAATLGATPPTPNPPRSSPVLDGMIYSYTAEGGGCEVDGTTGALTLLGADGDGVGCRVTLTAAHSGYGEQREVYRVTIERKTQTAPNLPTHPYGGVLSLAAGKSMDIVHPPMGGVGSPHYNSTDETQCRVDTVGRVTGVGVGSCTIQVVWSGDDEYAPTEPRNLIAALPIVADDGDDTNNVATDLTQAAYGPSPDLTVGGTPLAVVSPPVAGTGQAGTAEYRTSTPEVCSVDLGTGVITGLAVGDCRVQVRHVGSATVAASDWSGDYTISVGKGNVPVIANPYGTSNSVGLGGRLELEADLGPYGAATFTVGSGPCVVDGDGVIVTTEDAAVTDECTVQVAFDANDNYEARDAADFAIIAVVAGEQRVTFGEPYGADPSLMMGDTLALAEGNGPVSDQGGVLSYQSADTSICTVDSTTGEVTPVAVGECVIRVQGAAVPPNYAPTVWIDMANIPVQEGVLRLDWNPQRWGRVGGDLVLPAVNDGGMSGVTTVYSVQSAGDTGCSFSGTRTLSFTGTGVCVVTATGSKAHYGDWIREHAVRVRPAAITVTPGEFAAGEVLKVGEDTPKVPGAHSGLTPSDAIASWQLVRGERDCELVNAQTGAVRARAVSFGRVAPVCSVQVVARKQNYETVKSSPVGIPLAKGEIGDVAIRYGNTVTNFLRPGGTADMTPPPWRRTGWRFRSKVSHLWVPTRTMGPKRACARLTPNPVGPRRWSRPRPGTSVKLPSPLRPSGMGTKMWWFPCRSYSVSWLLRIRLRC